MVNPQGTSFIPQRPTKGKTNTRRVRKIYVLTYISYVLFFGAVLAAAGTFFYNVLIESQLQSAQQTLTAEREKFSQSDIESVRELDKKIKMAGERLNNHISVVSIFEAIEASAVQSLRFIEFSYERLNDEAPVVVLKGTTGSFDSVIFQRDVLKANPVLADGYIEEVDLETIDTAEGENAAPDLQQVITFELSNQIDPSLIGYSPRGLFGQGQQQQFDMNQGDTSFESFPEQETWSSENGEGTSEGQFETESETFQEEQTDNATNQNQ